LTSDRFHPPTLALGAAALALALAVTGWAWRRETSADEEGWLGRAQLAAAVLAAELDPAEDPEALQARLNRVAESDPLIVGLTLARPAPQGGQVAVVADWSFNGDAHDPGTLLAASAVMAEAMERPAVAPDTLTGFAPWKDRDGNKVGLVGVRLDAAPLVAQRSSATRTALAVGILAAVGLGLLGAMAARRQEEAPQGRRRAPILEPPPLKLADSEVVGRRFETLAKGLHERAYVRETFGRYVSQRVSDVLAAEHGAMVHAGEDREVTLLRADFDRSALAGRLPAPELLALVNGWIGAMAAVGEVHGGFVDFQGDAMLVVFGAPVEIPDAPERAVRCAVALRERFAALRVEWEKNHRVPPWGDGPAPRMRIALHRGKVVMGNFGNPQRVRFGVIGEPLDVVEGLEGLHRSLGTEILLTADVLSALPAGQVNASPHGSHQLGPTSREIFSL
jgi:class 3 adenylate cyclase